MKFFQQAGKMSISSRMRVMTEVLTSDASKIFELYEVPLESKWFPVFYLLSQEGKLGITDIAKRIGHSHPSVSKIVREMVKKGFAEEEKDLDDKRKNLICLSEKGQAVLSKIEPQYQDITQAVESLLEVTKHNLWKALDEFEYLLEQKSMFERVRDEKKNREAQEVEIVEYSSEHRQAFKDLNLEWIEKYFEAEETDLKMLNDPEGYILDKGGFIYIALYKGEAVGAISLIKMKDKEYDFELAKMGVSPAAQGKSIGWLMGQKVIDKAKSVGAQSLYLESNTILKPAISLYRKMGFRKVSGHYTPYQRCNIQMVLDL